MCWLGAASLAGCGGWVCSHGSCTGVLRHRGLGLWAGEQRRHRILSCPSILEKYLYFFRSILPLANIFSNGGCGGSSFHTFLFPWPWLGLQYSGRLVSEWWLESIWFASGWWGGVGLVCCGALLLCIVDSERSENF